MEQEIQTKNQKQQQKKHGIGYYFLVAVGVIIVAWLSWDF